MSRKVNCIMCGKKSLDKDTIGINKKLLGENIDTFFCLECLAIYLDCSISDIQDKIEEFKESGCKFFS